MLQLRVERGKAALASVTPSPELLRLAAEWSYILRSRSRWSGDEDLRRDMQRRAKDDLRTLGVSGDALLRIKLAPSHHVEIEFLERNVTGADADTMRDAASVFPWEFVISAATREVGRSEPLLITRVLERKPVRSSRKATVRHTGALLFVESAPGRIEQCYSFDSERSRLEAAVAQRGGATRRWTHSRTQSLPQLTERVRRVKPDVIHVTGVDNHQVTQLLDAFYDDVLIRQHIGDIPQDGMILRGPDVPELPVPYDELAAGLVDPDGRGTSPGLVTLNLCYSAARTARECVRRGAGAAIAFLDEVSDDVAEYFFQAFYWSWGGGQNVDDVPGVFGRAWNLMRQRGLSLYGTGIVLWLSRSAFATQRRATIGKVIEAPHEDLARRLPTPAERARARQRPMNEVLQVDLKVPREVNYSLLHNSRSFLETLTLTKLVDHPLDQVSVEVELSAGDGSAPFRHTEVLFNEPQRALASAVKIPLTAELLRSPRERVQSTLYVRVAWDGRIAAEQTESVTLLPVDEWFDDTENNPWLPSFVLPRDPAVVRIVSAARRHLVTLQDDPAAGFDGYQSTDVPNDDCDAVDQQVQALWTAIVQDFRLAYINPPPAYSERNQRLRTPSEILSSNSGTCIDLSLLLASCLEYVDIYPVLVLLSGHAFVGYWRSEEYHDDFRRMQHIPKATGIEIGPVSVKSTIKLVDEYGWRLALQQYAEIHEYVRRDKLRFLEATGLCFNYSFGEALAEGKADIKAPDDFDSLLDINLARSAKPPVTPLPMILAGRES